MLNTAKRQSGLTLIETMVAITIASLLLLLAMPGFSSWSANQKIRAAAEGVLNGLQTARLEALKRNQAVDFVLTDSAPTSGSATASASGKNWIVRVASSNELISGWSGASSSGAASAVVDYGSSVSTVSFNSLGRNTSNSQLDFNFTLASAGSCKAVSGELRCLRVSISNGGEIRMCDPSVTTTGDTRKC